MLAKRYSLSSESQKKLIGSWIDFNKKVTNVEQTKSLLAYLPTIAGPTEYPLCKTFLDDLLSLIKELGLDQVFAHSDEQVNARLAHIVWNEPQLHKDIIILMGGFHQLSATQKTIFKRHSIKSYQKWVVDTETVGFGSAGATSSRGLHCEHVKALMQQLQKYDINPFASCRAGDITTGVKLPNNLTKGLSDTDIIGEKACNVFI